MKIFSFRNHYYTWSGIFRGGRKTGEIAAANLNFAKHILQNQGIKPVTLSKKKMKWMDFFESKISSRDITLFFRQLATLIVSGIPVVQSFEILRQGQEKLQLRLLFNAIKNEIEKGKNLTQSLRKFPNYFDNLTCHLINMGEQTGTLDSMLKRIATHKEKQHVLKNKVIQALLYPAIVVLISLIVSVTMLIFVIPRFENLFLSMHNSLPEFTRLVIGFSKFIRNESWVGLLPIFAGVLGWYGLKKSFGFRCRFDHYILQFPWVGRIIKKVILTRLARNLAITYAAGIPITEGLKVITPISNNQDYIKALHVIQTRIIAGQQLHAAMQNSFLFPAMTVQMIKVGEESGALEPMLEKIAELYESEINDLVTNLEQMLEPLIMVILGVLIGGMVIAMYLPIFKLGTMI